MNNMSKVVCPGQGAAIFYVTSDDEDALVGNKVWISLLKGGGVTANDGELA